MASGHLYVVTLSFTLTNAGGTSDILSIQPAANKPCLLRRLKIGQTSEVAEAQEEGLRFSIQRLPATFTVGSGGTAITTPPPVKRSSAAASFTARMNDTTIATTSGTIATLEELGWNERASPVEWVWDADEAYDVINGEGLIVLSQSTPADDLTMQVTALIEQMG